MAGCYCMGKAPKCTCDSRCRCDCKCEFTDKYETWGDVFATKHDGDPNNVVIELRRYGGRAKYVLDTDDSHPWENPSHKKPPNCS